MGLDDRKALTEEPVVALHGAASSNTQLHETRQQAVTSSREPPSTDRSHQPMFDRDCESPRARCVSPADLRGWYAHDLQPKVARAAAQGWIDPGRASELHRLMTNLLQSIGVPHTGAGASR